MLSLDLKNKHLLKADVFVKEFKTLDDFREWALDSSIKDLKECIKVFEGYELYEHCAIMKKLIDDLK